MLALPWFLCAAPARPEMSSGRPEATPPASSPPLPEEVLSKAFWAARGQRKPASRTRTPSQWPFQPRSPLCPIPVW